MLNVSIDELRKARLQVAQNANTLFSTLKTEISKTAQSVNIGHYYTERFPPPSLRPLFYRHKESEPVRKDPPSEIIEDKPIAVIVDYDKNLQAGVFTKIPQLRIIEPGLVLFTSHPSGITFTLQFLVQSWHALSANLGFSQLNTFLIDHRRCKDLRVLG